MVLRFATGWTVRGSNSSGGEIFHSRSHRISGTPSVLYNGYLLSLPGYNGWAVVLPPPPTRAEIKERVEIYVYALFGPSWSILGWTLYLHIMFVSQTCNENVKIKIYIKNTVSRFVLHGCQIWFQNKALKRISGYKRQEVTGGLLPILFTNKPSSV